MCGKVTQHDSVTTMLGVFSNLAEDRPEDAVLLLNLYSRECMSNGADEDCVLASMLSASVYITMGLLGDEAQGRIKAMKYWWAAECPS